MRRRAGGEVAPTLAGTISRRLALTSLVAIALQVGVVLGQYYLDEDRVCLDYVGRETAMLLKGVKSTGRGFAFELPGSGSHYATDPSHYAFRIHLGDDPIASSGGGGSLTWSSPRSSTHLELWLNQLDSNDWLSFAGGQRYKLAGRDIWIEVATIGDPNHRRWGVLAAELSKLVWLPMVPLVVLLLGVALLSVRRSLAPLAKASARAEHMSFLESGERFDLAGMPREVGTFAAAINRLLDRSGDLLKAQKMFSAKAAHELRTPLAIMTLELAKIPDPRARRLEGDVAAMSEIVNRLLTLARLGTLKANDFSVFDLRGVVDETVEHIRTWVEDEGHVIVCERGPPCRISGDATAVREAVRNLIENAVKHTPRGCRIEVSVDRGGGVTVLDDGRGFGARDLASLLEPFAKGRAAGDGTGLGLAIVRQAVDLHRGRLEIGESATGGARVRVDFTPR